MSEETAGQQKEPVVIYDASAHNRFPFEVRDGGQKYDTAHVFSSLSDERYLQWLKDLNVRGTQDNIEDNTLEATASLWDDLIVEVENVEEPEGGVLGQLIDPSEKQQAINELLAVAIKEPEAASSGKRKLGVAAPEVTITTQCWFNGKIVDQQHVLTAKTLELEKRYERIQAKRTKTERIGGLRRQPKIEYVPQDEAKGKLYDEMCKSVTGFFGVVAEAGGYTIPLRFKTLVVDYFFAPTLDPRVVGK